VHQEACPHLNRTLHLVKDHGCLAGVVDQSGDASRDPDRGARPGDYILVMSVNPGFGGRNSFPGAVHKIRRLADLRAHRDWAIVLK